MDGNGWIQSGSDFANHIEVWHFYQSGQFVHQRALHTDRFGPYESESQSGKIRDRARQLDFIDILYTVTEIFAFARNLAYGGVLDPAASLTIELHNAAGYHLVAPPGRALDQEYIRRYDEPIIWEQPYSALALLAKAPEYAVQATIALVAHFGWMNVAQDMLAEDQRRFLERRL